MDMFSLTPHLYTARVHTGLDSRRLRWGSQGGSRTGTWWRYSTEPQPHPQPRPRTRTDQADSCRAGAPPAPGAQHHSVDIQDEVVPYLEYLLDLEGGGGVCLGPALVVPGVRLHHGGDHQLGPPA